MAEVLKQYKEKKIEEKITLINNIEENMVRTKKIDWVEINKLINIENMETILNLEKSIKEDSYNILKFKEIIIFSKKCLELFDLSISLSEVKFYRYWNSR